MAGAAKSAHVAASIHQAFVHAQLLQRQHRTVHRIALGNAAQVNPHRRAHLHVLPGQQQQRIGQPEHGGQRRGRGPARRGQVA